MRVFVVFLSFFGDNAKIVTRGKARHTELGNKVPKKSLNDS
jgi:hypothetical protein